MSQRLESLPEVHLSAENIGGINTISEVFRPGVTVLVGENATNRTSLLQAVAAALGTEYYTLKRDADTGQATLTIGERTYSRTITRRGDRIETSGDPYLENPELAELYAILLESNEVRQAVRNGGDIRELIVRPLDVEQINERISEIVEKRREIDSQLDQYDKLESELAECRAERNQYEDWLDELETKLERKESELEAAENHGDRVDSADSEPDATETDAAEPDTAESDAVGSDTAETDATEPDATEPADLESELDRKLEQLHNKRGELEEVEETLAIERNSLDSLREDKERIEEKYERVEAVDPTRLATLEERRKRLRQQKQSLGSTVTELQQVIRFNEERISESGSGVFESLEDGTDVVGRLDPSEQETVCWTCGTQVSQSRIEETLESLRELHGKKISRRNEIASDIEAVNEELSELETRQERHDRLESRLAEIEEKIEQRESTVERLEERRSRLETAVSELESATERLKADRQSEVLELKERVSELQFERHQVREQLSDLEEKIERLNARIADRESLEAEREELSRELKELRTRVEQLEAEAVDSFNRHMAEILDTLAYENIERIWLEITEQTVTERSQQLSERVFDLHIVRKNSEGEHYEDRLEHLSESERELVGLVVALSGYLAHDIQETVPFMLLDSVEMIDGERLVSLAAYLEEYVPYLVVVLLPDHADAFAEHESLPDHTIERC